MAPHLLCLPSELHLKIFHSLTDIQSAINFSQSCQQMHSVWIMGEKTLVPHLLPTHKLFTNNGCLLLGDGWSSWDIAWKFVQKYHGTSSCAAKIWPGLMT